MEEKVINSMDADMLSPFDLITLMFERTDEDGIVYIPAFNASDEDYRCRVDWNMAKYEKVLKKFEKHYNLIQQIAPFERQIEDAYESAKAVLGNDELLEFWNTYIRRFDIGNIDYEKVLDIDDRLETIELVRDIAEKLAGGKDLNVSDRNFLSEYMDIKVSDEEKQYRQKYVETVYRDAENRLGKKLCAYSVIIHSMRLCRLINLKAPEIITHNEACALASSMVLYEYGISRECVDNTRRLHIEKMELMSEEELDEISRPKKSNTRKSMAPLFVYSILKEKSSSKKHLRQQDILNELSKYPYEVMIERKALSRIIHNLIDSPNYAVFQDKSGVWIDQEGKL